MPALRLDLPRLRLRPIAALAAWVGFSLAWAGSGCGTDDLGTVRVTAFGEAFIEEGIGADLLADGWAVEFSRFELRFMDVTVAEVEVTVPPSVDVAQPSGGHGHLLGTVEVPAGRHTHASFLIARVEVAGRATRGSELKTFAWSFDEATRYTACEATTVVPAGGEARLELTIHGDHLFFDSLVAAEPALRFDPLAAADGDGDGEITRAELAATGIGAYDPGSAGGIDDLWTWLQAQVSNLGHVDGEGHCVSAPAR